jgi:hypothetical protein
VNEDTTDLWVKRLSANVLFAGNFMRLIKPGSGMAGWGPGIGFDRDPQQPGAVLAEEKVSFFPCKLGIQ